MRTSRALHLIRAFFSLRVSISDTAKQQFTLPSEFFPRAYNDSTSKSSSDLAFNYDSTPFAFWITRVSDGDVLFDTRGSSLPPAPTTALDGEALNSFNLVFEDQYLQVGHDALESFASVSHTGS